MTRVVVFNHHALPFDSVGHVDSSVLIFLRISLRLRAMGLSTILVDDAADPSWFRVELAPNYYWQDWYTESLKQSDRREMITAFRSIVTQSPLFLQADIAGGSNLCDVRLHSSSEVLPALSAAIWHDAPLVSFPTRHPWNHSPITALMEAMDVSGTISSEQRLIINLYSLQVLDSVESEMRQRWQTSIQSGRELLEAWTELFPFIELCGKAEDQLRFGSLSPTLLGQVKESLTVMNDFAKVWNDGVFDVYSHEKLRFYGLNHQVSGESETVANTPALRKHREFWLPTGIKAYFENHVKLVSRNRLHFFPDNENRRLYVGYIGPHLPLE